MNLFEAQFAARGEGPYDLAMLFPRVPGSPAGRDGAPRWPGPPRRRAVCSASFSAAGNAPEIAVAAVPGARNAFLRRNLTFPAAKLPLLFQLSAISRQKIALNPDGTRETSAKSRSTWMAREKPQLNRTQLAGYGRNLSKIALNWGSAAKPQLNGSLSTVPFRHDAEVSEGLVESQCSDRVQNRAIVAHFARCPLITEVSEVFILRNLSQETSETSETSDTSDTSGFQGR